MERGFGPLDIITIMVRIVLTNDLQDEVALISRNTRCVLKDDA